jgi:hypothetical protein
VGPGRGRLPGRQFPGGLGRVERQVPRHHPPTGRATRAGGGRGLPPHRLERPLRDGRPAPVRLGQLRHRPRRLHPRGPGLVRGHTTWPTARTIATAATTTARGTAASRADPRPQIVASARQMHLPGFPLPVPGHPDAAGRHEIGRTQRGNNAPTAGTASCRGSRGRPPRPAVASSTSRAA